MTLRSQMKATCRHFTGIQHDACEKGVDYKSVRVVPPQGMAQWPCIRPELKHLCPFWEATPDEEIERTERELAEALGKLAKLSSGEIDVCPECGAKIEHMQQVGRCVYLEPCGHRLWQDKVPEAWRNRALPTVRVEGDFDEGDDE